MIFGLYICYLSFSPILRHVGTLMLNTISYNNQSINYQSYPSHLSFKTFLKTHLYFIALPFEWYIKCVHCILYIYINELYLILSFSLFSLFFIPIFLYYGKLWISTLCKIIFTNVLSLNTNVTLKFKYRNNNRLIMK